MSAYTCPRCGSHVTEAPEDLTTLLDSLELPRKERLAVTAILDAWPRYATKEDLVWRMYDAIGEEADRPEQVVQSHISKLRTKLATIGWTVESRRFQGYRFCRLASEAG